MLARGIYLKVVIVLVLMPILLVSLTCLEASPNKNVSSRPHASLKDSVFIAGVFHYLDVNSDIENGSIYIIAYSGDTLPEPGARSVKNYYRWEYNHGVWQDASGHDSSYIDPSKCTKENNTYSFYIGISSKANPGSWKIKIFIDNKETASTSLNVIIGDFCLLFSTTIGMFQPSIKYRNSLVERERICFDQQRKMMVSEENIDKIVDGVLRRQATSLKEEKSVDKKSDLCVSNDEPLDKEEPLRSTVSMYPRTKLKEIKNDRTSSLFFDEKGGGRDGFCRIKLDACKRFFVTALVFILFSTSLMPAVVLTGENGNYIDIAIVDVQSLPSIDGKWTVMFKTVGRADLTINAVNGTTWSNNDEEYDLKFLELGCGNDTLNYEWANSSIFVGNYSSDKIYYETSQILTPGVHTLMFCFGNDVAFASNLDSEIQLQTNNSDFNNETKNNINVSSNSSILSSNSSLLNETSYVENTSFVTDEGLYDNLSPADQYESSPANNLNNKINQTYEDYYSSNDVATIYDNFWDEKAIINDGYINSLEIDYTKAWKYVLGCAKWNIQANVNDSWQNINGLTIDYVNLSEDNRKFSLDFTATIQPQADYRLTLAIDIPVDDYSFDSENTTFTLRYTAFGHKFIFEYSYSDISALPGLIFDHGISDGKFWFSIQKNNISYGTHIYLDPTYGLAADQTTSAYEYDPDEGRYPDMIRLGTSEYYAIVSTGDTGAENDGYIRTIRIWNNNGTIQQSLVDWLEYDDSDGYHPSIINVGTNMYAIGYYDDTANKETVVTVGIDTSGNIDAAVTDTLQLTNDGRTTSRSKIIHMTGNVYAYVYSDVTTDLWLETFNITSAGIIDATSADKQEINGADGIYPDMCLVDSDTVAIVYDAGTAGGNDGFILTRNISAAGDITNTNASSWEFDGARGATPTICKVSGTTYVIAYEDTNSDLYVKTCTIADTGAIAAAWIDTQAIDTSNGDYPTFFNVSVNVTANRWIKGISFVGTGTDGWVSTFDVTSEGVIGREIDTLTFGADTIGWYLPTCFVSGFYFASVLQDASADGWIRTYQIYTNNPPQISNPSPTNGATSVPMTPQLSVDVSDFGDILFVNWSSNSSGSWQGFGTNQSIYSYGAITDTMVGNINEWEYDPQEGLYPDVIRLGTSNYYAVVSTGDTGAQGFGYIRVIKAWNTNGTIQRSLVSSYRYDASDGDYPRIQHISGDIYAIAYYDDTANLLKVVTTEIDDADGICTGAIIDTIQMSFDTQVLPLDFIRVINNVFAVAYTEVVTNDGWFETMTINDDGTIDNALLDSEEFDETYGRHPRMCMVDADTVAIISYDGSATGDGYLYTYNVSAGGIITDTNTSWWEFDGDIGTMADIKRVYGNVFAIAYEGTSNDGWIKTVTIADTGAITKSWIDTYEFDKLDGGYQRVLPLGNNLFAITYQGNGADGWMKSLYISDTGDIASFEYDELEFNTTDNLGYANMASMGNDYYIIVYPGTGNDGYVGTVKIGNSTETTLHQINADFSFGGTKYYWRVNVTDGINTEYTINSFTTAFASPVINSYDVRNASGSKLNNATGLLDVNKEYCFTINITDSNGWVDIDYVEVKAWYDNGSEGTIYNNSGNLGGNLNMHLQYVNTTGVASWEMLWPDDEVQLISASCTETIINMKTRIINITFKPLSQTRWASSNNTWDPTQNNTNDPYSWNFNITVTGATGFKTWTTGEYGIYKFSSILPEQDWVGIAALPGFSDTSNVVTITYSSNYNYKVSIYFEENLTNEVPSINISITNNVYILANADLNDDILADMVFGGIGEANAVEIINDSGIFNKNNISQTVHVQFNVYIPFGTIGGEYTAHVATKIKHD
jgi:hypothetical protein